MACYLCAYNSTFQLRDPRPLPSGSPAKSTYSVGTCKKCSVWACSKHGRRIAEFKCAICMPADATEGALGMEPVPAATELVRANGAERMTAISLDTAAGSEVFTRMRQAIGRIVDHGRLTTDLAGTIFQTWGRQAEMDQRISPGYMAAVSNSVESTFRDQPLSPGPSAPEVVAYALVMAYAVADPEPYPQRLPWGLAEPRLLDPVMWLVAVAYNLPAT
jgi:hypothetical protein